MSEESKAKRQRGWGEGCVFEQPGSRWLYIQYYVNGKRRRESTKTESRTKAQKILTQRLADIGKGIDVNPKVNKITTRAALQAVEDEQRLNRRASADQTKQRIADYLLKSEDNPDGFFAPERRLATITTGDLERYAAYRVNDRGAKPATVNRELAIVRRAFRLAHRRGDITQVPFVPMLEEKNVREGFLEREQLDEILKHVPEFMVAPLELMFATGWRKNEVFSLTAAQVDIDAGTVRLEGRQTKSRKPRLIVLPADLRTLIAKQLASIDALKENGVICPWVFHRPDGSKIQPRKVWETAREKAGYPNALLHDFRRSAVRNLERAGVRRATAMKITGHVTESIYKRYFIEDEAVMRDAAEAMQAFADAQRSAKVAKAKGQLKAFRKRTA
jgi:integrase